jgi:hypothetical protein
MASSSATSNFREPHYLTNQESNKSQMALGSSQNTWPYNAQTGKVKFTNRTVPGEQLPGQTE